MFLLEEKKNKGIIHMQTLELKHEADKSMVLPQSAAYAQKVTGCCK